MTLSVVKVGGSLFDLPDLGRHLLDYFERFHNSHILIVPGGGATADAVREFDRLQGLGETVAHDLALRALTLNAHFLAALLTDAADRLGKKRSGFPILNPLDTPFPAGLSLLDAHAFCVADSEKGALPASWDATSDSVAARVAVVLKASLLILLKSVTRPQSWEQAVREGVIDPLFLSILRGNKKRLPRSPSVAVFNFRREA